MSEPSYPSWPEMFRWLTVLKDRVETLPSISAEQVITGTFDPSLIPPIPWSRVLKAGSSLGDLETRSASALSSGTLDAARLPAFTGDATAAIGTGVTVLATVNTSPGTYGSGTAIPLITVNGKGLVTNVMEQPIQTGALARVNDTNVTATLTGTPLTALLKDVTITLGWTGTLAPARGGTGIGSYTIGDLITATGATTLAVLTDVAAGSYLRSGGVATIPLWSTLTLPNAANSGDIFKASGANAMAATAPLALTKTDDTNVTLTLGGSASTALVNAASLTLGWTGTLSVARGGSGIGSYTIGDLLYASGATTLSKLADVAVGSVLISGGVGVAPAWSSAPTVTSLTASANVGAATLTASAVAALTTAAEAWVGPSTTAGLYFKSSTWGFGTITPNGTIEMRATTPTLLLSESGTSANAVDIGFRAFGRSVTSSRIRGTEGSVDNSGRLLLQTKTAAGSLTSAIRIFEDGRVGILCDPATAFRLDLGDSSYLGALRLGSALIGGHSGNDYDFIGYNFQPSSVTGSYTYTVADFASMIHFASGGFRFNTAVSGSAGGAITVLEVVRITRAGLVGIGQSSPTAILHLKAGTATANTAPLKLASGPVLTAAEAGAIEFTTDDYFATITTGAARKAFILDDGARLTSGKVAVATTNGRLIDGPTLGAAGLKIAAIQASARSTAQVAAVASVTTFTNGAADGSYIVSANVNVTVSTTHSFSVQVDYTDETNTAQTLTLTFSQLTAALVNVITNVTGAGPYEGLPVQIRCKASTAITVKTTGTFTIVTYNVEGLIQQVA